MIKERSANHVIAAATNVITVASVTYRKYGDLTGNISNGRYSDRFAVAGVSLKQRPKLYCF